jgi:hypothetical protein
VRAGRRQHRVPVVDSTAIDDQSLKVRSGKEAA